jgi:HEAT repeat protein
MAKPPTGSHPSPEDRRPGERPADAEGPDDAGSPKDQDGAPAGESAGQRPEAPSGQNFATEILSAADDAFAGWVRSAPRPARSDAGSREDPQDLPAASEPRFPTTGPSQPEPSSGPPASPSRPSSEPLVSPSLPPSRPPPAAAGPPPDLASIEEGKAPAQDQSPDAGALYPEHSDLFSTDALTRREAMADLLSRPIGAQEIQALGQVLLDPDPEMRRMAVDALDRAPTTIPSSLVERGLRDPDDRVRAAMVRLAAQRGRPAIPLILPLALGRRWPMAQHVALEVLPEIIDEPDAVSEEDLLSLLTAMASLEPPPFGSERAAFGAIARAVGRDRLVDEVDRPHPRRLGAVRLLVAEESTHSLRHVAALSDDPLEEIRNSAEAAANLLGTRSGPKGDGPPLSVDGRSDSAELAEDELITALARALLDPDEPVRLRARAALGRVRRPTLTAWTLAALVEGNADGVLAAAVAEELRIQEAALPLLRRACSLPPEARGPFVSALTSLSLGAEKLASLVKNVNRGYRQDAVRLCWQLGGREVLPFLRPLIEDTAGSVRMAVLEVFGESGDPAGLPVALEVLKDDSSAVVRATAVHVLARADPERRLAALAQALADPDPDVRATAVETLPHNIAGEAADLLHRALEDQDQRVWRAAFPHLIAVPERDLSTLWTAIRESGAAKREELVRAVERLDRERLALLALDNVRSADRADRSLAIEIAARAGTAECTAVVVTALEDPDPLVRRTAATAIPVLRTPAAVPALARTLSDPQAEVRVEAVRALGLIDDDGVLDPLVSALKDPEVRVRDMASEALTRWRSPAVARRLATALASPDLRRATGDVLERMGEAAVEPLVDALIQGDPDTAAAAGALLERIAGPQRFVAGLSSMDPEERLRSVYVLGAIGGPNASEALLTTLTDPDQRVRVQSVSLLGRLGDPRAVDALRRTFRRDPVMEVAETAERALRQLEGLPSGDPEPPSPKPRGGSSGRTKADQGSEDLPDPD